MSAVLPYTEQKNPISAKLSDVPVTEMLKILVDCHKQIFTENLRASYSLASYVDKFEEFAAKASEFLQSEKKKSAIILGGCGTSGRICFLTAMNQAYHFPKTKIDVLYACAGNKNALFKSVELVEDDAVEGAKTLERLSADYDRVVYIGISVGLWAPYVAGQLNFALSDDKKFLPTVIGFNPPHLARNVPIKNFSKTFRGVVEEMEQRELLVITPVILPEALSGSSRMKGGLATVVILDLLFRSLNAKLCGKEYKEVELSKMLASFAAILETEALTSEKFAKFLTLIANSLRNGGSLLIEAEGDLGILAAFDCSEAEPTFNVKHGEVVSGIHNEWLDKNLEWIDDKMFKRKIDEPSGNAFRKALEEAGALFDEHRFANSKDDAHVVLESDGSVVSLSIKSDEPDDLYWKHRVEFALENLYDFDNLKPFYIQALAKLILQMCSTVTFCQLGKVYGNIMIDVKTSNSKLLHRGIRSVADVTGCDINTARQAVVAAVKQTDSLEAADIHTPDDEIITESIEMSQIVPCAVVIVLTGCAPAKAFELVRAKGRLCDIVAEQLSAKKK